MTALWEIARSHVLNRLTGEALSRARHPTSPTPDAMGAYLALAGQRHQGLMRRALLTAAPRMIEVSQHYPTVDGCRACAGDAPLWPCQTIVEIALGDPICYDLAEGRPLAADDEDEDRAAA